MNVMVCGESIVQRLIRRSPIVYRGNGQGAFWKWARWEIFECTGIGTGCMMIKTELFQHLEEPWFKTVHEYPENLVLDDGLNTPVASIQETTIFISAIRYFCGFQNPRPRRSELHSLGC